MYRFDRFGGTELPSQDEIFSKLSELSGGPRSDSEYTHVTRVWTIADYHNIYLQLDVFPLAVVLENSRPDILLHHYFTC